MTHDPAKTMEASLPMDIILPTQFFAAAYSVAEPERRLRLAVLQDALRYYQQYLLATDRHGQTLYQDAAEWFSSPDRDEPFSFENVCDALQLDADYIRRGLQRWRAAELAGGGSRAHVAMQRLFPNGRRNKIGPRHSRRHAA